MRSGRAKSGIGQGSDACARNHGGHGSALERSGHKVMAVESLSAHGEKKARLAPTVRESME